MCNNYEFGLVVHEKIILKIFLVWSSGGPYVQRSGTICAII